MRLLRCIDGDRDVPPGLPRPEEHVFDLRCRFRAVFANQRRKGRIWIWDFRSISLISLGSLQRRTTVVTFVDHRLRNRFGVLLLGYSYWQLVAFRGLSFSSGGFVRLVILTSFLVGVMIDTLTSHAFFLVVFHYSLTTQLVLCIDFHSFIPFANEL